MLDPKAHGEIFVVVEGLVFNISRFIFYSIEFLLFLSKFIVKLFSFLMIFFFCNGFHVNLVFFFISYFFIVSLLITQTIGNCC